MTASDDTERPEDTCGLRPLAVFQVSRDHAVDALAYAPTGREIACAASSLFVLDACSSEVLFDEERAGSILALEYSPDGRSLAQLDDTGRLAVRGCPEKTVLWEHDAGLQLVAGFLAFSPDSRRLACSTRSEDRLRVFDALSGEIVWTGAIEDPEDSSEASCCGATLSAA